MFLAAVCPPAPLLIDGLAPRLNAAQPELVDAVRGLMTEFATADRIVILAAADRHVVIPPGTLAGAAAFARSDIEIVPPRSLPGSTEIDDGPARGDAPASLATGTIVAAHLLTAAGIDAPTTAVQVPVAAPIDQITETVAGQVNGDRAALLVMAGGAAAHGTDAPAGDDDRAPAFDARLGAALASGDRQQLADTCRELAGLGAELRCDELPLLAVLAQLASGPAQGELLHYSAPLGIGYPVARWRWPIAGAAS